MKYGMRMALLAGAAAVPIMFAGQADAAVLLAQGASGTVTLAGVISGTSLSATAAYAITTYSSTQLVISWTLTNTTPVATPGNNRLVSFGFDLLPDPNRTITGVTANTLASGWGASIDANITNGTTVDICAWDGNNCPGGGNQGVGETLTESFILTITGTFNNPLSMDNFVARYQSIGSAGDSGIIGETVIRVPEPATLALLGAGLLGLGLARRMRRKA